MFFYPWETHQKKKMDVLKKKSNLACRMFFKWTKRHVIARNSSSHIPRAINLFKSCSRSIIMGGWLGILGGGASSPLWAPLFCTACALHRRRGMVTRSCWLYGPSFCMVSASNWTTPSLNKRMNNGCRWSLCLIGMERLGKLLVKWGEEFEGLALASTRSWVRPKSCWPSWIQFQS